MAKCLFNADKYNWMRDAVIAMERYYINDVQTMIRDVAARTVGLDDNNTKNSPGTNGYSINKINSLINQVNTTISDTSSSLTTKINSLS